MKYDEKECGVQGGMKMKLKKLRAIAGMTLATILAANSSMVVSASNTTHYAYCIGVEHASTDTNSGDFTDNVKYAATCYGMMNNFRSYYQTTPSVEYLRSETNPNGVRKLASDVVFLNGHANPQLMAFGESLGSGVYYGYDAYSSSYQYAGLKSIGTMSTVDLISFVGCSTAGDSENLASVAYAKGATTSVGFTNSITSRFNNGPRWLERYNDHLANGYSVQAAVNYASACYPDCDLSTYVKIYGSTTNTITNTDSLSLNVEMEVLESENINIPVSDLNNCNFSSADTYDFDGFDILVSQLENLYNDFNVNDYKITVNMYSDDQLDGMIMLTYYIGEDIATNKAYIVSIENGVATEIIPSSVINAATPASLNNEVVDEKELIAAVERFEQLRRAQELPMPINMDTNVLQEAELVETREKYFYDYSTNELSYSETYYYLTAGEWGLYFDEQSVWTIEVNN